jgi:hypothetical protein
MSKGRAGRACDGWGITLAVGVALVGVALAPSGAEASTRTQESSSTVWLCRPGMANNPCESDLTTTEIEPNGSQKVVRAAPAKRPPVDCFYVYPSVSAQPTLNANLNVDPELAAVAVAQASRFSQTCRVFAPVYRELTVVATAASSEQSAAGRDVAYDGVVSAWRDYLAHDNKGRGIVLIGHSQGAGMLTQLLSSEIDPKPRLRRQLVSALLLGGNVTVAAGRDSGGDFQHIPACRRNDQTGCVVAYSSFDQPPPPDSAFARVGGSSARTGEGHGLQVLCVNPAALGGGAGTLEPYRSTIPIPGPIGAIDGPHPSAPTPWVRYPGRYTAKCESKNGATWLQITDIGEPTDQPGPFQVSSVLGPTWGLHLQDMNLALGNLVDLVHSQVAAFRD